MPPRGIPLKTLLLRTFLPAVVVVAMLLAGLVYNRLHASILDGFGRKLVTAAALTGAMIDPADHDRLISAARAGEDPQTVESSDVYRRNAAPMRRIREELDLTYLYTQVLGGPSDIFYVLDGTQGEDHSPLGSADDLTDDTRAGLRRLRTSGAIYTSPIEYQEQWGLLKTAAAPVLGADGRITGSAGADVNISVIQVATQNALFMSAMIGVGSILLCLLVSMSLVRRIADPIGALTEDMLQIAGGNAGAFRAASGPREVRQLAATLNALVEKTAAEAQHRDAEYDTREAAARAALLAGAATDAAADPVVLVANDDEAVLWVARPRADPATILAHRAMTRHARRFAEEPDLASHWRDLVDLGRGQCLAVDGGSGTVGLVGAGRMEISIGGRTVTLDPDAPVPFDPGESVALVRAGGSVFVCWRGTGQ